LSIGKLGAGRAAADYYVKRQAGCELDYYTGDGERRGVWCGAGAGALGLVGELGRDGERILGALLAGESPTGERLVGPVMRLDPRARVPAEPVVATLQAVAAERGVALAALGLEDASAVAKAAAALERAQRRVVWPVPSLRVDVVDRVLRAVGADPVRVLRGRRGRDRFTAAMRRLDARVDVRLSGLDFTLSAPKSVSVLYGLGSEPVAAQVRAAHDVAVRQALAYMERMSARGLRGHHGRGHRYAATDGLVAAAFEHRTSREGDPQLHTHVVVANLVRGIDGKWGALDTRQAFRHARSGGFVYQAVLRGELSRRLGVSWTAVRKGQAEIDGIPRSVLRLFSKRRAAITAAMAQMGRDDPGAAQAATLTTRPGKTDVDGETLRERWEREARDAGTDPRTVVSALNRGTPPAPPEADQLAASLLDAAGLTRDRSSFDRREVMQAVCAAIPPGTPVDLDALAAYATRVVRDAEVVPLLPEAAVHERRYSTTELLELEVRAQQHATERAADQVAVVPAGMVEQALAGVSLPVEQVAMVRRLTTSGAGVDVVVGPAGSGKTRALAAARTAWAAAGLPVVGVALAAIAARVLEDGAGIPSTSLARLLADARRVDPRTGRPVGLPVGGVLVVDEAGMLGTRALNELIELTATYRLKLVAVGDPHQLPEIEAGGLFAALIDSAPTSHLSGNQRQRAGWERAALAELRDGDVLAAVRAYDEHGRLRIAETTDELSGRLVADYRESRTATGPGETVVVTSSRADARRLNRLIRQSLVDAGELGDTEITVQVASGTQRGFRCGDEVVVTANDYPRALLNGTRGVVAAVDERSGRVTVRLGDGRDVSLPRGYLESGRLVHGYALTCHRAQGMTVEVALVSGSVALTRESGYVAMSRGRQANTLYLTHDALRHDLGGEVDRPRTEAQPSTAQRTALARAALVERLEFSGRQRLAVSWLPGARRARRKSAPSRRATGVVRDVG